jgi:Tfp pilus assembly protein PilW
VETLIAMVLGLAILAGVLKLMGMLTESNTTLLTVTRLEQDLRTVMDIMLQDMRRANQYPQSVADLGNPGQFVQSQPSLPQIDGQPLQSGRSGSLISYAYQEADGKVISGRFSHDTKAGTVLMHTGSASAPETITDPAFMQITQLVFKADVTSVRAGTVNLMLPVVEITLTAQLKASPEIQRTLVDRVSWRNSLVSP